MTLREAYEAGELRLRRDPWNPYAHIELMDVGESFGPWLWLRDVGAPPEVPAEQKLLVLYAIDYDDWEPWSPPEDVERIAADWPNYKETQ